MFRLGLTGGIGSGKTSAATVVKSFGACVIDADAISRATTAAGGSAIAAVQSAFGPTAIDANGAMDRAFIRELVFREPAAKAQLEAIIHPLVRAQAEQDIAAAERMGQWIVQDIPLLVESGRWRGALSAVLVIDCLEATQIARVQARSGWNEAQVRTVMSQQATRAQRLAAADFVVFNDGIGLDELAAQLQSLITRLGLPMQTL
jgi:dephospho-CoA kinase